MKKKIIILTSNDIRHKFFRIFLSNQKNIIVQKTYSELNYDLKKLYKKKSNKKSDLHLFERHISEIDFFDIYINSIIDKSKNTYCKKGYISSKKFLNNIIKYNPDYIIVYGSSIIKGEIISKFKNKIINIHLGLSPYYRGIGTNFFPFINFAPEYAGVTFMFLDEGIDTGKIIHQDRARIFLGDNIHSIGNRLIYDMTKNVIKIIENCNKIRFTKFVPKKYPRYFYKKKDYNDNLVGKIKLNFNRKIIETYIEEKNKREKLVPIFKQKWLK